MCIHLNIDESNTELMGRILNFYVIIILFFNLFVVILPFLFLLEFRRKENVNNWPP